MLYKAKWASATYLAQQMRGARGGSQAQAGEQPAHTGANGPGGKQLRAAQPGGLSPAQAGKHGWPSNVGPCGQNRAAVVYYANKPLNFCLIRPPDHNTIPLSHVFRK